RGRRRGRRRSGALVHTLSPQRGPRALKDGAMAENEEKREKGAREPKGRRLKLVVVASLVAALAAVAGVALLVNIMERKQEARNPFYRVVELTDETEDPELWGKNFPMQYDGYKRTVDQVRTRYGGSEALPH